MQGLDLGAVIHWTSEYEDDNLSLTASTKLNEPRSGGFPAFGEIRARKVSAWATLDLLLNYTFNLPSPLLAEVPGLAKDGGKKTKVKDGKDKNMTPVSTAEYGCNNWHWWLNNTTLTLGMQNVFDADPPFVAGSFENGYDESIASIKGRFWYVGLKKRF
jgi:outer membrane receptor protein involved in Fe transport